MRRSRRVARPAYPPATHRLGRTPQIDSLAAEGLSGKSQRELSDLGLIVEKGPAETETAA